MSPTNDDLPLNNRSGNVYDSLFADRIDALGKSSRGSPTPNRKGGNGNGGGWPVGVFVVLALVVVRGCTSLSSSSSSSSRDYKVNTPRSNEPMRNIEPNWEGLQREQEPQNPGRAKAQQAEPPAAPDEPDRQP